MGISLVGHTLGQYDGAEENGCIVGHAVGISVVGNFDGASLVGNKLGPIVGADETGCFEGAVVGISDDG